MSPGRSLLLVFCSFFHAASFTLPACKWPAYYPPDPVTTRRCVMMRGLNMSDVGHTALQAAPPAALLEKRPAAGRHHGRDVQGSQVRCHGTE
ncbi:MAG: hypothetical protein J3K34DRAFT_428842 [Monoraphidium minutum]|nr:MAG: hypothetical protein J3K34DRAFT_428842 [Monoraphidium minutum]